MTVKTAEGRDRSILATVIHGLGGGGLIATEKEKEECCDYSLEETRKTSIFNFIIVCQNLKCL